MASKRTPSAQTTSSTPSPSPAKQSTTTTTPSPSSSTPSRSSKSATNTTPTSKSTSSFSSSFATTSSGLSSDNSAREIIQGVWRNYMSRTPQRVKLIDTFMAFLVVVGVLQFVYCVVGGNYPFNAFLSGFSATVGQFVLTASLRIQTNPENREEFKTVGHERAFADYVFGSLILHFFCVNFIN